MSLHGNVYAAGWGWSGESHPSCSRTALGGLRPPALHGRGHVTLYPEHVWLGSAVAGVPQASASCCLQTPLRGSQGPSQGGRSLLCQAWCPTER